MKRFVLAAMMLLMAGVSIHAAEEFSEVEYYEKLAAKKLAEAEPMPAAVIDTKAYYQPVSCFEDVPPANAFIVLNQYHHSRSDSATMKMGNQRLKTGKSRANGGSTTLIYNRVLNDWASVALMYEFGFMHVRGGMAVEDLPGVEGYERTRYRSNVVGILPEFKLGVFGKLQPSVILGFDRATSGSETVIAGNNVDTRDIDGYGTNVISLMAWWEKDIELGCSNWKLTPYAGWRSLHVDIRKAHDWGQDDGARNNSSLWAHLISGGFKLAYQKDRLGINLRAGVNHRTTSDDLPGYANRAVAPGVVHFSHRANMDRTVGAVGAGMSYAINKHAIVGIGYDGMFGKDTSAHTGSLSFVFPF